MAGRPTKLTPEVQAKVCQALAGGNTRSASAYYAGIRVSALKNWMVWGLKGREPYRTFVAAVRKAEADCEARNVAVIQQAARGTADEKPDWKAAAWWLERRKRRQYGQNIKAEVSGSLKVEVITNADWYKRAPAEGDHAANGHAPSNGHAARP